MSSVRVAGCLPVNKQAKINVSSNKYGFNLVPSNTYSSGITKGDCTYPDVNVSVFERICKDGIDAFTESFSACSNPADNGKSVFYDQFDDGVSNGYGRAFVVDKKTIMSDL